MRSLAHLAAIWFLGLVMPCRTECCPFCGWETDETD